MTAKPLRLVQEPPRSAARQTLADLTADLNAIAAEVAELQPKIAKAEAARAAVPAAEAALSAFLLEADLDGGKRDSAEHHALRQVVRTARADAVDVSGWERRNAELNAQFGALQAKRTATIADIIAEEAEALREAYHAHGRAAIRLDAALVGLAEWALINGHTALGVQLQSATWPSRDLAEGVVIRAKLEAEAKVVRDQWRGFADALRADPDAAIADPAA